jgi:Arc/MetJ-type ribon-helix-helix transcriptional regulator
MMTAYDAAMRTIIDLPEDQIRAIDAWRKTRGVSRAEAIRQAVSKLLTDAETRGVLLDATHGIWADRPEDGVTMQRRLRAEWDHR